MHREGGNVSILGKIRSKLEAVKGALSVERVLHVWNIETLEKLKIHVWVKTVRDALDDFRVHV